MKTVTYIALALALLAVVVVVYLFATRQTTSTAPAVTEPKGNVASAIGDAVESALNDLGRALGVA